MSHKFYVVSSDLHSEIYLAILLDTYSTEPTIFLLTPGPLFMLRLLTVNKYLLDINCVSGTGATVVNKANRLALTEWMF